MSSAVESMLATAPFFRRLSEQDRARIARIARVQLYEKGDRLFCEGDPSDVYHTLIRGRVKIYKMTPAGKDVILTIVGPGDPLGTVAVYMEIPYPATAEALEDCVCLEVPRQSFFGLLAEHPSMARGLMLGLTHRIVELTRRLASLTGSRVEPRFARLFLKLAEEMGREETKGTRVPLSLSRQELADLTGTTIETCIRIMSRWGKEGIVLTEEDGFLVVDHEGLRELAASR